MVDRLSPARRSALMARVSSKDTAPEMRVRRAAHALGYRYRLHDRALPGRPDLVFPRLRKVILVHGCFWHRHPGCPKATAPKSHVAFWSDKFARNVARDSSNLAGLQERGWRVLTVWECETRESRQLSMKLSTFLGEPDMTPTVARLTSPQGGRV
jgi:DNA mismatch endonuclease, patch repair protein